MTSNLSAFAYIPERAPAVPALWNDIFSVLSSNIAAVGSSASLSSPSGNTVSISTNLDVVGGAHFQFLSVGSTPPSYVTTAAVTIEVNSAFSDYLYLVDSSAQKSSYVIGSRAGNLADGLNIWDASAGTMIASFSKQSIRFFQNVVGPVFDVGGALASTLNAATFGVGTDSVESRIQAAISAASIAHISRVYVPANMYPYSAGSVSFDTTVQMVREGGRWDVYDVQAYGAKKDGTGDATAAVMAIISTLNPSATGGTILFPSGIYNCLSIISNIGSRIAFVADAPGASVVRKSHNTDAFRIASGSDDVSFLNMGIDGGSTFSGRGIHVPFGFGVRFSFVGGSIRSTKEPCIEFGSDGGERSTIADCTLSTISSNGSCPAAIRKVGTATKALPMIWSRIQTDPFVPLFSGDGLYGASINDCYFSGMDTGFDFASNLTNVRLEGCRIGNQSTLTLRGTAIVVIGTEFFGNVSLNTDFQNGSVFVGNTMDSSHVFTDNSPIGSNNVIMPPLAVGTMVTPKVVSIGTIQGHSTASTIFISNSTIASSMYSSTLASGSFAVQMRLSNQNRVQTGVAGGTLFLDCGFLSIADGNSGAGNGAVWTNNGTISLPAYAYAAETALGLYRSGASRIGLSYGQLAIPDGSATTPSLGYSSNSSLGFYSSGVQTIAQSYGTFDLTATIASLGTIRVKSGANNSCGTAVLGSNGSVNVANTYVKTGDLIFLTDQTPGGTLGDLEVGGIRNSSGFTIQSTSITDSSTVGWLIIRPG